jgi:transposase-like protein
VAYWVGKHGLRAANAERHARRGALDESELRAMVERDLSVSRIAEEVGRSKTTVRHWLKEYGLSTVWAERRRASARNQRELMLNCPRHGRSRFVKRGRAGYRCARCSAEAVAERRRTVKRLLVEEAGGACVLCGYNRCMAALHFHHVNPADKRFAMSLRGVTRSLDRAREEARKCVLLCSNCHAEVESGIAVVSPADPRIE